MLPALTDGFFTTSTSWEACNMGWKWKLLSPVQLFATPWNSPGQNTGVDSLSLLQGIFPTQVSHIADGFFTSWPFRAKTNGIHERNPEQKWSRERETYSKKRILYRILYDSHTPKRVQNSLGDLWLLWKGNLNLCSFIWQASMECSWDSKPLEG